MIKLPLSVDFKTYRLVDSEGNTFGDLQKIADALNKPRTIKKWIVEVEGNLYYKGRGSKPSTFENAKLFGRKSDATQAAKRRKGGKVVEVKVSVLTG